MNLLYKVSFLVYSICFVFIITRKTEVDVWKDAVIRVFVYKCTFPNAHVKIVFISKYYSVLVSSLRLFC